MKVSLIKTLWLISPFFIFSSPSALGAPFKQSPKPEYKFDLNFNGRYAQHTLEDKDLASHRYRLELNQKWKQNNQLSGVFGGRSTVESVYAVKPEKHSGSVGQEESSEVVLRDFYLQYKDGPWSIKLGNQQVVWGEAFGFYYADIVNPKDLRDGGLGTLNEQRIQIPLLNLQWRGETSSAQIVVIPKPLFHKLPASGSDFGIDITDYLGLPIEVESVKPWSINRTEVGARLGFMLGTFDFSLLHFSYLDRFPIYNLNTTPSLKLIEEHKPLSSTGLTMSADLESLLLRVEAIHSPKRSYNVLKASSLELAETNETTYVVGADFTRIEDFSLSFQVSESTRSPEHEYLLVKKKESLASLRIAKNFGRKGNSFETIATQNLNDHSWLIQSKLMTPLSKQVELELGADIFEGSINSSFGRLRYASRAFLSIKAFLAE